MINPPEEKPPGVRLSFFVLDDFRRNTAHDGIFGNVLHYHRIGTSYAVVTHCQTAQHLCTAMDADVVANHRAILAFVANRHLLVNPAILANGFCADHCGKAVLDEQSAANVSGIQIQ